MQALRVKAPMLCYASSLAAGTLSNLNIDQILTSREHSDTHHDNTSPNLALFHFTGHAFRNAKRDRRRERERLMAPYTNTMVFYS